MRLVLISVAVCSVLAVIGVAGLLLISPQLSIEVSLLATGVDPIELASDVHEIQTRQFAMPLKLDPESEHSIKRMRLFVSQDQGKTWKHQNDYDRNDTQAIFKAEVDGEYWFALQVESNDGTNDPARVDALTPRIKVYVNTEGKRLNSQKSSEGLQREVEGLRNRVEQLEKKLNELETRPRS
jgi:hypothetical protein